jgi:predicted aspartyl protease
VDLSQLLGGDSFTFPCTISSNGLGIKTHTLIDTGANGYAFIDTDFAAIATRFLNTKVQQLPTACNVRGFDGKLAQPITDYIELTMLIDGRQLKVPMLVVRLGGQDIILGRKWAARTGVLINCKNRQLIWPEDYPKSKGWNRILATAKKNLMPQPPNPIHQKDADRRTRLMAKDTWRPTAILKPEARTRTTWRTDQEQRYKDMQNELQGRERPANKTE